MVVVVMVMIFGGGKWKRLGRAERRSFGRDLCWRRRPGASGVNWRSGIATFFHRKDKLLKKTIK
jgi:hypothetical protein